MITIEEIIELASNFKFRSKEYNLIEKLGDYYLTQPINDTKVEYKTVSQECSNTTNEGIIIDEFEELLCEVTNTLNSYNAEHHEYKPLDKMWKLFQAQQQEITAYVQAIYNGSDELTRYKKKLNAIEEVVNEGDRRVYYSYEDKYRKIKQIIGEKNNIER